MKPLAWILLVVFFFEPVLAKPKCSMKDLEKEKNIIRKYLMIQRSSCNLNPDFYLNLSQQAYLSENYSIGIWAIQSVLNNKKDSAEKMAEYYYFLGLSFIGKKRNEEAISTLKKIVFSQHIENIDPMILQKSHMALIQAYYQDNPKKNDGDIAYLIKLFKSRYRNSDLLYAVFDWNTNRISH